MQMIGSQLLRHRQRGKGAGIRHCRPGTGRGKRDHSGKRDQIQQKETLPLETSPRVIDDVINRRLGEAFKASSEALDATKEVIQSVYASALWQMNDLSGSLNSKRLENAITTVTDGMLNSTELRYCRHATAPQKDSFAG